MDTNLSQTNAQASIAVKSVTIVPVNKRAFHNYNIGVPAKGLLIVNSTIEIMGWIVGKKPVIEIEIISNNQVIESIPVNVKRQDLTKLYENLAEIQSTEFGFHKIVNIDSINENSTLLLQAVFSTGKRSPVATIRFESLNNIKLAKSDRNPDFLIIGAMKAATSAIYDYLLLHPQVIRRQPKEIHFFSYKYNNGLDWYLSNFAAKEQKSNSNSDGWLIGEASPSYLNVYEVPSLVKKNFPNVKLIVSLRNPTDRAISQYYHHVKRVGDENRTLEEVFSDIEIAKAIEAIPSIERNKHKLHAHINEHGNTALYLLLGHYIFQLRNWLKLFPREQILILNYHDLESKPQDFINQIFDFLNLQDYNIPNLRKIYSNQYPSTVTSIINKLNKYYASYNSELEGYLDQKFDWS